jgi:hypothetical protein
MGTKHTSICDEHDLREVVTIGQYAYEVPREVAKSHADLLAACVARIKFDMKVGREPGVDEGPLPTARIEELAREQAVIVEAMVNAVAKATGATPPSPAVEVLVSEGDLIPDGDGVKADGGR